MNLIEGSCSTFIALIEALLDSDHLINLHAKNASGSDWSIFKQHYLRIQPHYHPNLLELSQSLSQLESQILDSQTSLISTIGCKAKELMLECNDVHNIHFRVTKLNANKMMKALDSKKVKYTVLSVQKAGTLFLTDEVSFLHCTDCLYLPVLLLYLVEETSNKVGVREDIL
jgi:DNA replicative helicase MCM subunit Mcm2 (Cdc46/Mcm family)